MSQESSELVEKIIEQGTLYVPAESPIVGEKHLDEAIAVMIEMARKDPGVILTTVFNKKGSYMSCFGLAVLSAAAPLEFLSDEHIRAAAIDILEDKNPIQLLEFVEYLKSKVFGRGFGSRPQKWVRKVMESWNQERLEKYISSCPEEVYDLIRLVHPRYKGNKGTIVSELVKNMS